ncbi:hypothetical protein G1K57_00435 [Tenacibaculum finnmarkense]|uniref:hypothetical protein n=1 Tax=Tenacibaculum finnmarkense TaxID=2781243 RepID=UPI001EFA7665|nr:hypothetical protein [Tenacibaculum finnmarkense]MCG8806628.1 hypothetical protein [Tenacibaculum finnmarkense]MCG8816868.1 hypothetical protein [Tenacibaculum finnmarkense]
MNSMTPIFDNKLDKLIFLVKKYRHNFNDKKTKQKNVFITFLKTSISDINKELNSTLVEMQTKEMHRKDEVNLCNFAKKLNDLKVLFEDELKQLDIEIEDNLLLEDFYDFVDIELEKNKPEKTLLPNHLEKEKHFNRFVYGIIIKEKNIHPDIFKDGAFEIFTKWMEISNNDKQHRKISFIIQKLKQENKLNTTVSKILIEWLNNNNYIDKKVYADFFKIKYDFVSAKNVFSKGRLALYNTIKSD